MESLAMVEGEFWTVVGSVIVVLGLLLGVMMWLWRSTAPDRGPLKPVDGRGWTLVVDGSNMSYRRNKARLAYMEEVLEMLGARFEGAEMVVYCDASLRHQFRGEERERFEEMLREDERFRQAPKGRKADDFLLQYGREHRAIVVSHDWFSKGPELEMREGVPLLRISFREEPPQLAQKIIVFEDGENPERPSVYELEAFLAGGGRE